jgi:outer membrane protein assembly factor BamE
MSRRDGWLRAQRLSRSVAGVAGAAIALSGCAVEQGGAFDRVAAIASPYSAPVRQGNWVEPEAVAKLRKGMSQEEVRLLLSSPLLVDPFRNNRWDYLYRFDDKRGHVEIRRLTLFFANGALSEVAGDVVAAQEKRADDAGNPAPRLQTIEIPAAPSQ